MIRFDNVSFSFSTADRKPEEVISSLSMEVAGNEIACLVGQSGSGKSTILNLIAGILQPNSGRVVMNRVLLSYLMQEDLLLPFRTTWQNIFLAAELREELSDSLLKEGSRLVGNIGLSDALEKLPSELSGGMRRRAALARQLIVSADAMLLDEPFTAQDRVMRSILEDLVYDLCRKDRRSAVIVTHDLDTAVAIADRVLVLGANKRVAAEWRANGILKEMRPSERRCASEFVDHVTELSRLYISRNLQ